MVSQPSMVNRTTHYEYYQLLWSSEHCKNITVLNNSNLVPQLENFRAVIEQHGSVLEELLARTLPFLQWIERVYPELRDEYATATAIGVRMERPNGSS